MATVFWKSGVSGAFNDADDWLGGVAPGPSDNASLTASGVYTVTVAGDVAVASLATAAGATLDVASGALTLAQGTGGGANAGMISVAEEASLEIGGTFANTGQVSLNADAATATLYVDDSVVLTGAGRINLNVTVSGAAAQILGDADNGGVLTNRGQTIQGAGAIGAGDGALTFINQMGQVVANTSGATLTVFTGNAVANSGTLKATNGGTLTLVDEIDNAGGTVAAISAGSTTTLTLEGTVLGGAVLASGSGAEVFVENNVSHASLTAANLGQIAQNGTTLSDDVVTAVTGGGVTLQNATLAGDTFRTDASALVQLDDVLFDGSVSATTIGGGATVVTADGSRLEVKGALVDKGLLSIGDAGGAYTTMVIDHGVTLSGGGRITLGGLTGAAFSYLLGDNADHGALTNLGDTIDGAGQIGGADSRLKFTNAAGVVDADIAGASFYLYTGQTIANNAKFEATNGGQLVSYDKINNAGGVIAASGAGSTAYLNGVVTGGAIQASVGGVVNLQSAASNVAAQAMSGGVVNVSGPTLSGAAVSARGANSAVELNSGVVVTGSQLSSALGGVVGVNYATLDNTVSADAIAAGTRVLVNDGGRLMLTGALSDAGEIDVGQAGSTSYTALQVEGAASLNGAGKVVLAPGSGGAAFIWGESGTPGVLTNNGETIVGAGGIGIYGDKSLTFINQAGLVDANVAGQTLTIATGNVVTNDTLMEATAGGTLNFQDAVANAGAVIEAFPGSAVNLYGEVTGGTVEALGAGAAVNIYDGVSGATVKAFGGGALKVQTATLEDDTTSAFGAGSSITLDYQSIVKGGSLAANGGATLTDVSNAMFDGSAAAVTLAVGTKLLIADGASLDATGAINIKGEIDIGDAASQSYTAIYVSGAATISGGGKINLTAAPQGYSWIFGDGSDLGTLTNQGDTIEGAGGVGSGDGHLTLDNAAGLILANAAGATLSVSTGSLVTNAAKMEATQGGTLAIYDSVTNAGGLIEALAGSAASINGATSGGTVEAMGAGASLSVNANISGATVVGAMGGAVSVYQAMLDDDATSVSGAGSSLTLGYNSAVAGGSLTAVGGATLTDSANATLDGAVAAVTLNSKLLVADGQTLYLQGSIVDKGEIDVGDAASAAWTFTDVNGPVSLSGGGKIVLTAAQNGYSWLAAGSTSDDTLTNNGDSILGAGGLGYFGDGRLTFDNASGLVEANAAGATLTINTGNVVTNGGALEAAAGGQLTIYDNVSNASGLIAALAGGAVLLADETTTGGRVYALGGQIEAQNAALSGAVILAMGGGSVTFSGSDITGDKLLISGSGGYEVEGQTILDGTGAPVVIGQGVDLQVAATTLTLKGAIVNRGTVSAMASGPGTLDIDGQTTLSGGGAWTSTPSGGGSGYVYVFGDSTNGGQLTNFNDTVSGDGQIGGNGATFSLINQAMGVFDATGPTGLTIETGATVTNSGLLEATNPFGLASTGGLTIEDAVANVGAIFANGGDVTLLGAVTGGGKLEIGGGSTLTLGAMSSNSVAFMGAGELVVQQAADLGGGGRITGFAGDDAVDFSNLAAATTSITKITGTSAAGTWTNVTLTDSNSLLGVTLRLFNQSNGQYGLVASDYALSADSQGSAGTLFQLAGSV